MIGEAKKLEGGEAEKALIKGLVTAKRGTRYLFVTNGRRWEIYDTYRRGAVHNRIVWFDLKKHTAAEVCKKAKALQRSTLSQASTAHIHVEVESTTKISSNKSSVP